MCPACFTTAALLAAGGTSAGGLTAFVVQKLRGKRARKRSQAPDSPGEGLQRQPAGHSVGMDPVGNGHTQSSLD